VITVAPGKHRMPRRRYMARAALSAATQRLALTDPDWLPGGAVSRPQWDGPPLLPPDHPSAPVPRVRAPLASGPGGAGPSPARTASLGLPRSRPGTAARPGLRGPVQDAAAIRPEATAIRDAAEKEAAHLRAVILSLSEQLSQLSAYIRDNVASPGGLATMPTPAIAPPQMPAVAPPRPRTAPPRPRTAPPRPRTAPAEKPQARPRQYNAMRIATAATATLFSFAALTGATEIGLHGFKFFVFRAGGTGESAPNVPTDQQFLAQQAAAAKTAVAHTPGRHSAKIVSG
jgi:hypothetical protein